MLLPCPIVVLQLNLTSFSVSSSLTPFLIIPPQTITNQLFLVCSVFIGATLFQHLKTTVYHLITHCPNLFLPTYNRYIKLQCIQCICTRSLFDNWYYRKVIYTSVNSAWISTFSSLTLISLNYIMQLYTYTNLYPKEYSMKYGTIFQGSPAGRIKQVAAVVRNAVSSV